MADLNQLVQEALGGIIQSGGLPNVESLYNQQAQAVNEQQFAKGLGISSVTRDALAKARVDANLAAQQAQLSALGQAASVAQQELNRGQAGSQFGQQMALQKKALGQQSDIARNNLLAQGLGLGVGGLANVAGRTFGPQITAGLQRLFGLGSDSGANDLAKPGLEALGQGQQIIQNAPTDLASRYATMPTSGFSAETPYSLSDLSGLGSGGSLPDLSWMSSPDTSFTLDALSGLSDWGNNLDLSWLNSPDTTFSLMAM